MLYFSLGDFVVHPTQPIWGVGQVQSIVGMNVTVNFEHAGKQMINCQIITLTKTDLKRKPQYSPTSRPNRRQIDPEGR